MLTKNDRGYYLKKENRLKELDNYIKEHKTLDNIKENDVGRKLCSVFYSYKHLIEDAVEELGYDVDELKSVKTRGYYNDFSNIEKKIKKFIDSNKRFPTREEIQNILKIGHRYIDRHGGYYELKRKMNYFDESDLVDENLFVNSSMLEFLTAQFLIYNSVKYKREGLIAPNSNNKHRYDFYIPKFDLYVEIWGYEETNGSLGKEYNKKRKVKEKLYKDNNFKLLSIEPTDLSVHDFNQVSNKLTEIFSEYLHISKDIPHEIFISSRTLSDKEILNELIKYKADDYLPTMNVLDDYGLGYLIRLIRKRHGSYYNFAKQHGMKIRGKNIDTNEINKEMIYCMFDNIYDTHKTDILQKHLKKYNTGKAILTWIEKNGDFESLKMHYYNTKFVETDMIIDESTLSFLIRIIRNSDMSFEIKNVCKEIINRITKNDDNRVLYNSVFKKILNRYPYIEEEYIDNFNDATKDEPFKLTPNGFDIHSPISYYSYLNHYDGMTWHDILKIMGKENELHNYICNEFKAYTEQTNNCNMVEFAKSHQYITFKLMNYQDVHKWLKDANIQDVKKNRYTDKDLEENFICIKNAIHKIPLFPEFKKHTKISYQTYQSRFNLKVKVYDQIVRLYTTDEEFNEYLKEKKSHKSSLGNIGKISSKHTDENLKDNFVSVFEQFKIENNKYPSKREFSRITEIDESTYRKRLDMTWTEVVKYYGFNQSAS